MRIQSWLNAIRRLFARPRPALRAPALRVEPLEDRATPALFGVPWADPRHLTLSFTPDGTSIGGLSSRLTAGLTASLPPAVWQREILRAFQTWAVLGNVNVAVQPDSGVAFGTAGPTQGDPRFGDVRVGAIGVTGSTFAVAIPPDPFSAGTWAGDLLFNADARFGPGGADLFTVALHEAGHTFGLDQSTDPASAMSNFAGVRVGPAASDMANFRVLYGVRARDANEGAVGNNTFATATRLRFPSQGRGGYIGRTPLVAYGDIAGAKDNDTFWFRPVSGYTGPVTFRLQTAGISLLAPVLSVYDQFGRLLRRAASFDPRGSVVTVRLPQVNPNARYFIRITGATGDVFGTGGYGLAVTFNGRNVTPPARLDAVLRGPYETLGGEQLRALLLDPEFDVNDDGNGNDSPDDATRTATTPGFAPNTRFDMLASLATTADQDAYQVRAPRWPDGQTGVLTATVFTLEPGGAAPRISLFDRDNNPITGRILANGNGTFIVQATGIESDRDYYVVVSSQNGAVGNYSLSVAFGTRTAALDIFATGSVSAAQPYNLYVARTQLFELLLSAQGGPVRMTITNEAGATVATLTANAGDTVSGPGWLLKPGTYRATFEALGPTATFILAGTSDSDPIGPVVNDPSSVPQFTDPTNPRQYVYPGPVTSPSPFLWALLTV